MRRSRALELSRRTLMLASGATVVAAGMASGLRRAGAEAAPAPADPAPVDTVAGPAAERSRVAFTVNGSPRDLLVDNRATLLDSLRETLRLTGSKKGCDHGQCGACTVLVNGQRVLGCLTLAVMHQGDEITTIEGLGTPDALGALQAAFVRHDAYQCGYCTPGQICSATAALREIEAGVPSHVTEDLAAPVRATPEELRERMSGNLCRCGAYANIQAAIREIAGEPA